MPGSQILKIRCLWLECDARNPSVKTLPTEGELAAGQFVHRGCAALSATAITTAFFARLFEEFPLAQLLLDARVFHQLTEPPDGILN